MLPNMTANDDKAAEQIDRLAIVVSGGGKSKLLGVPKLLNGTGEAQATAVVDKLSD